MKKARRILVLTLSFGSGHVQAARAVAHELRRHEPDADVRIVDALGEARLLFRAGYVWPYWAMVRYAPALWERFFAARVARGDEGTAPPWALHWGCGQVFKLIENFQPETIVACEVAACEMAALAKRDRLTRARLLAVVTDHEAEPVWVKPEVDVYAVADRQVREQLRAWGAPAEAIAICGIPTDAAFRARHDARETRMRHSIRDDAPLVLLMGGGMGPTRMDKVAAQLCRSGAAMHIIAVAGRDARAHRRLMRLKPAPPVSLSVLGWTDDIPALMQSASILVTKPGGLTTAEAALCGLPVVFFDAIPGPERRNAARVADAGAGVITNSAHEAATMTLSLLQDETQRRRMSECAGQLATPQAAKTIAHLALDANVPVWSAAARMTA